MMTGIEKNKGKGTGFALKRLVASLLVLIQCASLAFVGVPVAYAEENLAPQDAVETVTGGAKQDPPPAQLPASDPVPGPANQPAVSGGGVLEADLGSLHVSVGFGADAGIPDGAFLRVRAAQLPPVYETDMVPGVLYISEAEQAAYMARMLQALSLTDSDLVFAQQYLTLEILDADAKPVTPASLLNVCIRFPQATPAEAETWAAVSFDETGAFGTENTTTVLTAASAMEYEGCTLRFALSDLPLIGLCSSARQWLNLQSQYMDLSVYGPANAFLIYDPLYFTPERGSLLLEAYSLNASSPAPCGATALWASVSAHGTADGQGLWLSSLNGTEPAAVLSETGSTYGFVYLDGANGLALFTPDLSAPLYADDSVILDGTVPPEVTVTVEDVSALYADFDLASLVQPEPVVQAAPLFAGWRKAFQMLTNSVPEQTLQAASPRYELIGAYDITLWLANETYQPEPGHPIRVHISDPAIAAANNLQLWHLHDDGSRERIYDFTVEGSTLSFDASGFSVYLVIGEDAIPRCTYTFWDWNQEEKRYKEIQFTDDTGNTSYTQTVKAGEMPIIPQLPASANQEFKGWYEGHIEGTELVLAESSYDFSTPITEDCAVDLYAVFTSYVDVLFHGQYDSGSGEFPVAFTRRGELDSGSATVTISDLSVTYTAGSSGEDMAFCGWSYTPISTPGAEWDDAGNPVAPIDGDSITVTENTSLYPVFQRIHWLTFYAAQSGSGASYNAPRYYFVDQAESGPLPVSQRDGYAFLGWYTGTLSTETVDGEQVETVSYGTPITDAYGNIEHVSTYDAGIELINGVMYLRGSATLYAKWEAKDAEYRIVIRKQSASDAADLPEAEKSYEYMESVKLSAPVGTSVSVPEEYKQKTYPGYSYARCDAETTVAADGSTVLYVYYDKNSDYTPGGTYTLRFVDPYRTEPLAEHTGISYQAPLASYEPAAPESARPGYEFTRWYLDEFCTVPADPDTMTMPDHDLTFYAGWDLIWYLVKIDPNYGSLATLDGAGSPVGSGSTWFWKTVEDEPIGEYSYVTRDYEESSSGEYFYVLHDRAYYGYSDAYEAGESSDRFSYYVRDPGQATEDKTFDYVPGIYSYAGWYEVHEDGSETPYVFGSPVDHNTTLRLHWKKNGIYFLAFSATNIAGDVSGLLENGQAVEEIGTPYEDNAGVVLDRVAIAPPGGGYTFIGWQVRGDESGRIYTPGENFILHADDAVRIGGKEVVYLHAVYVQVGTARIVYDFNGGTLNGDFDFGSPTKPGATSLAADGKSAEVFNIVNNSEFTLSSGAGLTRTNAVFKGWRDPVSMAIYEPGQTVGVDTAEPVTLVAAWEVKVNYHLNSADAAWGSGDWSGYEETDGVKSKRVLIGDTVDEPSAVPVYSGADGRMFRFWTTEPEGTTAYDFSAPVTDELQLYAGWSAPIEVPVHAVDASAETLTEQTGWVLPNAAIPVGEDSVTLNAATAAQYVTLPSGDYSFAFAAALNQAATRDNVSEADAVASIYYNQDARHLYLRYADAGREDVSLDENTEIYFFYYNKKELSIAYKSMLSSGELQDVSATGAPEATGILLGEYDMASHITQPLGWVGDSTLTNYAFAIGSAGVTNASGLSLITATSDSDDSRPPLLVENSWSGFRYSEDDGASWTSCGFDPTLYVVYFEQQPTVLMFHESTVGSSEILHTEFIFDLLVTETQKVTVSVQHQQLVDGSWVNVGKPTQTENSTTSKLFDTKAEGNQPYRLKDGEASSATLFYSSSTVETPGAESTEGGVTVRDLTVTTTTITQTAKITQKADAAFSTAIDGRLQTAEPYSYSYTSDGSGGTKSVTFTNTHKAIDVELHVALAEAGGLMGRDAFRSGTEANYRFQLPLGGSMKLPDTLPADRLFIGDSTVYAFGAVLAGKGEEGSHITDVLMGIASIAYSQIEGNEYGLILKDSSGNTLGTLDGQEQLYYLYYPMPRIEYVKLGDNGSLTPIGLQEEEYADPVITYNGAPLTMNGQTVEQGQRIEISLGDFDISQSGNNFRMPPVLDDGTFRRYLGYTYIAAGDQGVRTLGGLSAEPSPDLTMHLHLRENELGSMTLQFSYDGETWVDLPLTGSPTVYAIYTERGYDLQISKSLLIPDSEKTNPIFAGRTFTVTIESDAIKYAEYEAEGADSATVTATPATDFAPGSIVLTVEDGTRIRIKGLGRGEYTITEKENTNFVLTARRGSITAQTPPYTTVENNSTVTLGESNPLDSDTQVILINSPQELCRIVDNGTEHIFYTLRSAVRYIEENIASYTATIEMLTESYVIPAGDSVEIPNGFNVTLKTADSMSNVATITRGEDLTDMPVFTNNGSLTISELHLDGAGLDSTAPMIQSGGTQLTLGASSSIRNVSSIGSGGAISATAGDVTLSGTSITGNAAANGAALYYTGSGTITVSGSETKLQSNTASANGGAIYAAQGTIVLSGGASVSGNRAEGLGGAVYAGNASIAVTDSETKLQNNTAQSGGAIYAESSAITVSGGSITGNEAGAGDGGAIYVGAGSVTVSGGSLSDNRAESGKGGAIYAQSAAVNLGGSAEVKTNKAKEGGAVYAGSGAVTISGGTVQNNTATSGSGGAVYAGSGNVTVSGDSMSDNMAAAGSGGAVYAGSGSVTVSGGSMTGNTASVNGGAVSAESGTLTVTGTSSFNENTATTGKGGAFYAGSGAVSVTGATVGSNCAGAEGGALYAGEGAVTLSNVTATGNTAGTSGGAVYTGSGNLTVSGGSMADNTATSGNGGAVCAGGPLSVSNASLTGNKAEAGEGGAVYAGGVTATLTSVTASRNSAKNGAAVFDNNGRATINNGSYTDNTATAGGAIGVGSSEARLIFNGNVQVKDNLMNGEQSNVYLDQDDDAVINIDTLGASAAIGIHVPDPVVPTRSVPGARFANYTSNANVNLITNDRYPSLTVQSDTDSKKLYWGNSIKVSVHSLSSYDGSFTQPASGGAGTQLKKIDNYYPELSDASISELASELVTKNSIPLGSLVYAAAYLDGERSFGDYITELKWDKEESEWFVVKRDGETVSLKKTDGTGYHRIYIYYAEPAYVSIENNTDKTLKISNMQIGGLPVVNSSTEAGYGMVFAKNGAIRSALLPVTAEDLMLAPGQSINLLIPGGRNKAYTLDGSFDPALSDVRLRRGTGTYVEETLSLTGGAFTALSGTTLNGSGTYQIIFGDDKPICKVVDADGVEHPYSKISDAIAAIKNGTITLATSNTAVIEMLVDYLLPASDYVLIPRGYDITLTTATGGFYPYTGEGDRAIISRDSENTDSMIDAWNGPTGQDTITALDNTTLRITNLVFDGKSVQGSSDGGAVKSKFVNVYVDSVDFKNVYAANGGAMLIMFSAKDKNNKPTVKNTILDVKNSTFTGCTSTTTVTSNRLGGGAIVTNAETMNLENCAFDTCTAVDQAGAVFHRVDGNYNSWANISGCKFTNCSANAAGGLELDSKTITVTDCKFEHCVATKRNGGGFNVYALNNATPAASTNCSITLTNCIFNDCQAYTQNGGGFRSTAVYTTVNHCSFTNTSGNFGGGIAMSNTNALKGEIYGCTFDRCTATGQGGGVASNAIELIIGDYTYTDENGDEQIVHTEINNCTSSNEGGGVYHSRDNNNSSLTVTNATITGNQTKNNGKNGGGIWTNARKVNIDGSAITNNTCTSKGGGLYAYSYTSLTITDSDISRNTASSDGGGVWFDADNDTNRNKQILTVKGSTIDSNSSGASGGGIYTLAKTVTISGSETRTGDDGKPAPSSLSHNTAKTNGGGVYQNRNVDGSVLQISDAVINGNTANNTSTNTDQGGGGVFTNVRTLTIKDSEISSNTSKSHGGGVLFEVSSDTARSAMSLTVEGCKLDGNTATGNGGGIYTRAKTVEIKAAVEGEGDEAQKMPTVISNCVAGYCGGGIYQNLDVAGSMLTVTDSEIRGCTSNDSSTNTDPPRGGGGIFAGVRTITVQRSAITGNKAVRNGGGINAALNSSAYTLTVDESQIRNNSADYRGGGIYTRSQLNLKNGSEVTGNRLNSSTAENAAGVYMETGRTITVGAVGLDKDTLYINGNTTSSGEQSNLKLWDLNASNNNQQSVYVNCPLGGEILVVNAKQVGTVFGHANGKNYAGLTEEDHVFKSDHSTLYGIYNRSDAGTDPLGAQIIWAGPPIAKITGKDASGNDIQLYLGVNNPAIFDRLYSGEEYAENVVGAFNLFNYDTPPLYTADGQLYAGTEYSVKMLVERFETNSDINVKYVEGRTITFTTAGKDDALYPYEGRAARATVIRGSGVSSGRSLMNVRGNLTLTNIIIDGGTENGITPGGSTRCMWISGENCTVVLGEGAILQNGRVTGTADGGGVYVNNGTFTINGGVIRNCSARNGGGVYQNAAVGFDLVAGSIMQCTASGQGGGVYINKGPFNMTGGSISACQANAGGGVFAVGGRVFNMSGGSIVGNHAISKGGGIAVGGSNSKINFSRKVTVSGNTSNASLATEKACNVELDQDSNAVINTNNGGLFPGSYIGVYLPNGTNLYSEHGQEGQPFGTFAEGDRTTNLYSFVNDRNMLKGGLIPDGAEHTIYWIKIFSLKVTKELEHNPQEEIEEGLRFRFRVTVSGTATVSGQLNAKDIDSSTGDYGEMIFHSDGQYQTISEEFYLAPGESITAVNLSEGLDYKVEEYLTDAQAKDYATRPSRVIVGKIGENKERTDVDPYTSDLVFINILPVCKLTTASGSLLYQRVEVRSGDTMKSYNMPAVYTSLEDAFKAIEQAHNSSDPTAQLYQGENVESSPKYGVEQGVSIEMLTNVSLNEPQTVYDWETVTLKTASKTANQFPFRVEGARMATVTRAYNGASMLTVFGSLTLDNITLDGAKAGYTGSTNGGAVSVETGATLAVNDSVIRNHQISAFDDGGAEINGAGVYVADGASLHLSGQLDFGGKGTNAAGAIIEGSGNYRLAALPAGSTNGRVPYSKPRQDIYLAESHENAPASILITGDLSGTDGSIWVWAYSAYHYKQNMPFARLADGVDGGNLRIFRDAREDSATENGTETWLYGTPEGDTAGYVYWSGVKGSRRVILRKVNGSLASLQGAAFDVYKGSPGGDVYLTIAANSNAFGILWAGDLPYGTYYLNETKAPEGYAGGWYCLVVDDPAKMDTDPEIRGPFNSAERAVEAAAEIQNAIRLAGNG